MSYSSNIGDMLLDVIGSGWMLGLFLMAAFSFLCYKRGYGTLATGFVVYPVAVGIVTGGWLPKALQGFALLGVGMLWGYAMIKLFGNIGENSDIQKVVMIIVCWSGALYLSGFGVADYNNIANNTLLPTDSSLDTSNPMTTATSSFDVLYGVTNFIGAIVLGGSIVDFVAEAGLVEPYLSVVKIVLISITFLAFYPMIMKLLALILQGVSAGAGALSGIAGKLFSVFR